MAWVAVPQAVLEPVLDGARDFELLGVAMRLGVGLEDGEAEPVPDCVKELDGVLVAELIG